MRGLVLVAVVALAAVSLTYGNAVLYMDDLFEKMTPETMLQVMGSNAAVADSQLCPDENTVNVPNAVFTNTLFNTTITWRQAASLNMRVRDYLRNNGLPGLQRVCNARDKFYTSLGMSLYYRCINIFSFLQFTSDVQPGAIYTRMWQNIDFMCNVGFEQLITPGTWNCIVLAGNNQGCDNTFQASVNYTNVCPAVDNYMNCKKTLFDTACGKPNGYYSCEDIRLGYGSYCTGLRCFV